MALPRGASILSAVALVVACSSESHAPPTANAGGHPTTPSASEGSGGAPLVGGSGGVVGTAGSPQVPDGRSGAGGSGAAPSGVAGSGASPSVGGAPACVPGVDGGGGSVAYLAGVPPNGTFCPHDGQTFCAPATMGGKDWRAVQCVNGAWVVPDPPETCTPAPPSSPCDPPGSWCPTFADCSIQGSGATDGVCCSYVEYCPDFGFCDGVRWWKNHDGSTGGVTGGTGGAAGAVSGGSGQGGGGASGGNEAGAAAGAAGAGTGGAGEAGGAAGSSCTGAPWGVQAGGMGGTANVYGCCSDPCVEGETCGIQNNNSGSEYYEECKCIGGTLSCCTVASSWSSCDVVCPSLDHAGCLACCAGGNDNAGTQTEEVCTSSYCGSQCPSVCTFPKTAPTAECVTCLETTTAPGYFAQCRALCP